MYNPGEPYRAPLHLEVRWFLCGAAAYAGLAGIVASFWLSGHPAVMVTLMGLSIATAIIGFAARRDANNRLDDHREEHDPKEWPVDKWKAARAAGII